MDPILLISGSYNAFADGFNGAGVYMASGVIPSNTFALPVYYGGAEDFRERILYKHIPELTCGDHHNQPMRNYALKHGVQSLVWFCVEKSTPDEAHMREQEWLNRERPFADQKRAFNIAHNATAPMKGRKHSDDTKKKMSIAQTGRTHTQATKEKLRIVRRGKKLSDGTKQRIARALSGRKRKPYNHKGWRRAPDV